MKAVHESEEDKPQSSGIGGGEKEALRARCRLLPQVQEERGVAGRRGCHDAFCDRSKLSCLF